MKVPRAVLVVIGVAIGLSCLGLAAGYWFLMSYGPFPSGAIRSGQETVPFVWHGEMTGGDYLFVAALAGAGGCLVVTSCRLRVGRRGGAGAPPNGGSSNSTGGPAVDGGPPAVT